MEDKKKKIKISQIIIVLIVLALIAGTAFITKYITDNHAKQYDSISKWGLQFTKDAIDEEKLNYKTTIAQSSDSLQLTWSGDYSAPEPGESYEAGIPMLKGTTEKDLKITFEGIASISNDDFLINGVFNCPITFYIGKYSDGKPRVIKGTNFIGRKAELLSAINDGFDQIDIEDVKAGTDMHKHLMEFVKDNKIAWELPSDITNEQKEVCKNSKTKLSLSIDMFEESSNQ